MRLLSRISYYHFWLSVIVLGIAGFMLFIFLQKEVSMEIREQLELESDMVARDLAEGKPVSAPMIRITKGGPELLKKPSVFRDTVIYDQVQHMSEDYYYFTESRMINDQAYRIRVMTIYIGWENYSKTIIYIFVSIAMVLVILGTLVNYFISHSIWRPFLKNLKRIKAYSVNADEELDLNISNVREFQDMNAVLTDLVTRSRGEYFALKEFTENASHEIQTPLSILKSRLEHISQHDIGTELNRYLSDAKNAVNRLSRVNKGLLLLAKLENDLFPDLQWIALEQVIETNIEQIEDIIHHKEMKLSINLQKKVLFASPFLIETLVTNLLSNMLSHSASKAQLSISLNHYGLTFRNQGAPLSFSEEKLFSRFGKGMEKYEGNGLGLSIIRKICQVYQWDISYRHEKGEHIFQIVFA